MTHRLALALLLAASAAHAETIGASRFGGVTSNGLTGTYISRPSMGSNSPTCTTIGDGYIIPTQSQVGKAIAVIQSAEGFLASTETKGSHVSAGTGLVYQPAINEGTGGPSCTPPTFAMQAYLASEDTCYFPSESYPRRAALSALNLAAQATTFRGYANAERPGGSGVRIIQYQRFECVAWPEMQLTGFDDAWLVDTNDRAAFDSWLALSGGYSWSDSYVGWSADFDQCDVGVRLRDQIDTLGGDWETKAFYFTAPRTETVMYPDCAFADTRIAGYRTWRVAHAKALMLEGGADYVNLAHKLGQHRANPYVVDYCPNPADLWKVFNLNGGGANGCGANADCVGASDPDACCTGAGVGDCVTNPESVYTGDIAGAGFDYPAYVEGEHALALEMVAQGVPYAWQTNGAEWLAGDFFDDPGTAGVNENDLVRAIFNAASFIIVQRDCSSCWTAMESHLVGKPYAEAR